MCYSKKTLLIIWWNEVKDMHFKEAFAFHKMMKVASRTRSYLIFLPQSQNNHDTYFKTHFLNIWILTEKLKCRTQISITLTCLEQTPSVDPQEGHTRGWVHRAPSSDALWFVPKVYWSSLRSLNLQTPIEKKHWLITRV